MLPIVLGTPDQFARVREMLRGAGYTDDEVARRCEVRNIYRFRALRDGRTVALEIHDAFDVLLRLFMDEEPLPWATVRHHLGDEAVEAMLALGLVADDAAAGQVGATVLLYPTRGLYLASDLTRLVDGTDPQGDVVYPAVSTNTGHFLAMLPETPCDELLELCAGTGVAALAAAGRCAHVWATDVTARAVHFAEFNARLNEVANVTVAQGDLYEAVGDRTFDRIVAHPPYVPEAETRIVFRDGGEDGEQVTRGIVAGLPRHLRPGGTLHCTCAVTDRVDRPFERRVRDWLGEAEAEFDVFFMPQATHEPTPYFLTRAMAGNEPWENLERRHATFTRLGVERIVYGAFVVRRRTAAARGTEPLTVRRRAAPAARGADVVAMMERETMAADPALQARLLDLPMATNPQLAFALTHGLVDGDWQATSCHLHVEAPFVVDAKVWPWLAALLVRCDGTRSPRAIVAELRAEGMAPADGVVEELTPLLRDLVAADILRPVPAPAAATAGAGTGAVAARG